MEPSREKTEQTLQMMLDALDATADAVDSDEKRRESRRPLNATCELCFFHDLGLTTTIVEGTVRNISFRGLSVVLGLPAPVRSGRPVEVAVDVPNHTQSYVAGTVAFCRKVDGNGYELGLEVRAAGTAPILTRDVTASQVIYDWFAEALMVPE
ncbi:MAG: PilZ domain-containing protein [Phycisphaerae bacterium]